MHHFSMLRWIQVLYALIGCLLGFLREAAAEQVTIRFLSPGSHEVVRADSVTVHIAIRVSMQDPLERILLLVNGQAVAQQGVWATQRDLVLSPADNAVAPPGGDEMLMSLSATLPSPDEAAEVLLAARAQTRAGATAEATVRIRRQAAPREEFAVKPQLFLLAVGVSRYRQSDLDLRFPAKDATELAQTLKKQHGGLYRQVHARLLINEQATKAAVLDGLEWFQRQATGRDVMVLFLAGHGIQDSATGSYYFLPHDAEPAAVKRSMVSQEDIQTTLRAMAGKVVVLLDSCHAGSLSGGPGLRGSLDVDALVRELNSTEAGLLVMAAASRRQAAKEATEWGNGAFTKAILEGLGGAAAYLPGRPITINMLDLYVSERVKQLTLGTQRAVTTKPASLADFPFALPPVAPPVSLEPRVSPSLPAAAAAVSATLPAPSASSPPTDGGPRSDTRPAQAAVPIYRRWWLWTAVGGGVATAAILAGVFGSWQSAPSDYSRLALQPASSASGDARVSLIFAP